MSKNKSDSSPYNLNCDQNLGKIQKVRSFLVNLLRNAPKSSLSKTVQVINFAADTKFQSILSSDLQLNQTPSRNLSNLFWKRLNLEKISEILGRDVSVVEVGCGTGRYSQVFSEQLENFSYTGVDIVQSPDWKTATDKRVNFLEKDYLSYDSYLNNCNFIFTQSAAEHFRQDLDFFKNISNYASSAERKLVTIHLVPPPSSLYCYLWHGIRQYPIRVVNKIYELQPAECKKILVVLGGPRANRVHRKWITYPSLFLNRDYRTENPDGYGLAMQKSIAEDLKYKGLHRASFLGLITLYNMSDEEIKLFSDNLFK